MNFKFVLKGKIKIKINLVR